MTRQTRILSPLLPVLLLRAAAPAAARVQSTPAPTDVTAELGSMSQPYAAGSLMSTVDDKTERAVTRSGKRI